MPIRREFLDWREPGLLSAARHLAERFGRPPQLDLGGVVVAVPGSRAGRRLLEILVDLADERRLILTPPRIVTAGALPELLYRARRPFANELTQQLAWVRALQSQPRGALDGLARALPSDGDVFAWLALGQMLSTLHRELAADALDFEKVVERGRNCPRFRDERWRLLALVQRRYLSELDRVQLWDRQTARLFAIDHAECRTDCDLVLVGMVDMNRTQRQMLDLVSDRVTALVIAPPDLADRFDEHGCLSPERWGDVPMPIDANRVTVVGGPGDQADAVASALASFDGRYPAEDIVIGVPDEGVVPYVLQRLEECDVPARYGVGVPVPQTPPVRLLAAVAEWIESRRFRAFASLLRHPAIERWLLSEGLRGDFLTWLDEFQTERLPSRFGREAIEHYLQNARATPSTKRGAASQEESSVEAAGEPSERPEADTRHRLLAAFDQVDGLLQPLRADRQPLAGWGPPIAELLATIFGARPLDPDDAGQWQVLAACDALRRALEAHQQTPASFAPAVTGPEAIRLALQGVALDTVPPPPLEAAVELLGWLELPLDDAPALVVTGFNEGIVPSSRNADLFLPNELRRRLGLEDNDRRYARDAYALCALAASRKELRIVAGRRSADNDPLLPSRLLFACEADESARRTLRWLAEPASIRVALPGGLRPGAANPVLPRPPEKLEHPVTSMTVTEFRDYLACPYRYYLRRRLKLEPVTDAARELGPREFGTLLHLVLNEFGNDCRNDAALAACTSPDRLCTLLDDCLDRATRRLFGDEPLPAVRVQAEMVRQRLHRFANWQADWASQGWRIRYVEHDLPKGEAVLDIGAPPMQLRGRIDRIDVREAEGETVIFDYKSGDSGKVPDRSHRRGRDGEWVDLQLPLYRHAAQWLDVPDRVQVGYINLPKTAADSGGVLADWSDDEIAEAITTAETVARRVRNEEFWPPTSPPPEFSEVYAPLCGDPRLEDDEGD